MGKTKEMNKEKKVADGGMPDDMYGKKPTKKGAKKPMPKKKK